MSRFRALSLVLGFSAWSLAGAPLTFQPAGHVGFDVLADGKVVAPVRLCAGGVLVADKVEKDGGGLRLSEDRNEPKNHRAGQE